MHWINFHPRTSVERAMLYSDSRQPKWYPKWKLHRLQSFTKVQLLFVEPGRLVSNFLWHQVQLHFQHKTGVVGKILCHLEGWCQTVSETLNVEGKVDSSQWPHCPCLRIFPVVKGMSSWIESLTVASRAYYLLKLFRQCMLWPQLHLHNLFCCSSHKKFALKILKEMPHLRHASGTVSLRTLQYHQQPSCLEGLQKQMQATLKSSTCVVVYK